MMKLREYFWPLICALAITALIVRLASADPVIESWITDRGDSFHKKLNTDLCKASWTGGAITGYNTITLADSAVSDSTACYEFYETTGIAFFVEASGDSANFIVYAELLRPVAGTASSFARTFTADSYPVTTEGYHVFQVRAPIGEYIRFRFRSYAGNGASTVISDMRLNRSWP